MVDARIHSELVVQLEQLSAASQQRVLEFSRSLSSSAPIGIPGKELLRFAGVIEPDDADAMLKAIEEGCERINPHDW